MAFTPRTSANGITGNKYYQYAVKRTNVALPNCFTYATGRISEILGKNQSLDGKSYVYGAGDLWTTHAVEFMQSSTPVPGALAIWTGGYKNYGHVAVVEAVRSNKDIEVSYSNYEGEMFIYEKLSKGGGYYVGSSLHFAGFLVHKDLPNTSNTTKRLKYKIGTRVCVQSLARSADGTAGVVASHYQGTITAIYEGTPYPYLLDNGNGGFVNDAMIDSDPHSPDAPQKPSTGLKYGVGTKVCVQTLSKSADGTAGTVSSHYQGTITKLYKGHPYPYLLDDGAGFVNDNIIDKDPHVPK